MDLFWTFAGIGILVLASMTGVSMMIMAIKSPGRKP